MSAEEEVIQPVQAKDEQGPRPGAAASAAQPQKDPAAEVIVETDSRPFFFRHITPIVKFCAILLLLGMWACTVVLIQKRYEKQTDYSPWYCLGASTIVSLLEIIWFFSICACCKDDGGCCCACWRVLMWLDNWKKGFLYFIISIPTFINVTVLSIVCGVLIVILGLIYVVKSCADCRCVGGKRFVRRSKADKKQKSQPDEETPALSPTGS